MNFFKKTIKHFGTICRHKKWVFYYCRKTGIPMRGILHDLSKFSPTEFWEGVKYYQGTRSPIDACKEANGYSRAWFHHRGRNSHHYEYWVDNFDNGGVALKMPFKDVVEMLCDYLGAGRAYMGKNFTYNGEFEWWVKKSEKPIKMHPHTKAFISMALSGLAFAEIVNPNDILANLSKEKLKDLYESISDEGEYHNLFSLTNKKEDTK